MIGWTDAEVEEVIRRVRDARQNQKQKALRVRHFAKLLNDEAAFEAAAYHRARQRQSKVFSI